MDATAWNLGIIGAVFLSRAVPEKTSAVFAVIALGACAFRVVFW